MSGPQPDSSSFGRAARDAFATGRTYVEGYVIIGGEPFEHAWTVDAKGVVYDSAVVAGQNVSGYFGVPFNRNYLAKALLDNKGYAILGADARTRRRLVIGKDDDFKESDHPRDADGKFGAGGANAGPHSKHVEALRSAGTNNQEKFGAAFNALKNDTSIKNADLKKVIEEYTAGKIPIGKNREQLLDQIYKDWVRSSRFENKIKPTGDAEDAQFHEEDHPRGQPGNAGQFGPGAGGQKENSGKTSGGSISAGLTAAPADRDAWPVHVKALKVPPAWTDVKINHDPKAALQVIGKDVKGRAQYVYSDEFKHSQSAAKFARISELAGKFDAISRQNDANMRGGDALSAHAEVTKLIMEMGIRPGGEEDTGAAVKAYGATTLEGQHVVVENDETRLRFIGKKGVALDLPVTDRTVADMLRRRADAAGASGKLFPEVSAGSLLDYVHTLNGGGFKTKDFRTHLGTSTAAKLMTSAPAPANAKEYRRTVMDIAKSVAAMLGNTPTVALQSYIDPRIFAPWHHVNA